MKKKRSLAFGICFVAYATVYLVRVNLSIASPCMREAGIITATQIGLLGTAFSVAYAFSRLFFGILSDRTPPYVLICTGLAVCGIASVLVGRFPPFWEIFLLWSCNAIGQGMIWSSMASIIPVLYEERLVSSRIAILISSPPFGQIAGIFLSSRLITHFGLCWAFIIPGLFPIISALLLIIFIRDIPAQTEIKTSAHLSFGEMLRNPDILSMLVPASLHGTIKENLPAWMAMFLLERYAVNIQQSANFALLVPIAGLLTRLLYFPVYNLCGKSELTVGKYSFLVCVIFSLILCVSSAPIIITATSLGVIFAGISVANCSIIGQYPIRFAASGNTGSVGGVLDFFTYCCAGISSAFYGAVVENYGFAPMFISWAVFSLISFVFVTRLQKRLACLST